MTPPQPTTTHSVVETSQLLNPESITRTHSSEEFVTMIQLARQQLAGSGFQFLTREEIDRDIDAVRTDS
jgi:hypothetical protein